MSGADLDESDDGPSRYDISDAREIALAIRAADATWDDGKRVEAGSLRWRADLSRDNEHLHVHLADTLMPYMIDRLNATRDQGMRPHIAMPLQALCDDAIACGLVFAEPTIHIVNASGGLDRPEPLLVALGRRWRVGPQARKVIGRAGWKLVCSSGTSEEKGERLETLVCFLLGHISDFEVSEHRLNTATEELDVVVTIRANTGRCWTVNGSPFVLVEAKNWHTRSVGQADVSAFGFKIEHKRGTVRIGLMVGKLGFSPEARAQTLRTSLEPLTIALLGPEELEHWIDAEDGDSALEDIVRRAMLY
jgi:hypothetical protein